MKKITLFSLVFLLSFAANAQDKPSQKMGTTKSVYAEILGGGIGFSANFDTRFSGNKGFGLRAGIGFIPIKAASVLSFPLGLNYITGNHSSHLDVEATGTILTAKGNGKFSGHELSTFLFSPHIGYRYTKPSKSFLFRIYAGPIFIKEKIFPWLGLDFGYTL